MRVSCGAKNANLFLNMMLFEMLSFMYTGFFVFIFKHVYVQLC